MRPFFSLSLSSSSSSSLAHQKLCHSVKFSNHVFRLIVNSSFEDPSILVQTEFTQIDGRKGGMVCFGNRMDKFGSSIELFLPFSISRSNTPSRKCNRETSSNRLCRYRGDFARVYKYPCVERKGKERKKIRGGEAGQRQSPLPLNHGARRTRGNSIPSAAFPTLDVNSRTTLFRYTDN